MKKEFQKSAVFLISSFVILFGTAPGYAKEKEPSKAEALVKVIAEADGYFAEGNYAKAKSAYSRVVKLAPDKPTGYLGLGRLYFLEGDNEKALAELTRATQLAPDSSDVHFELGSTYLSLGLVDDAIRELGTADSISPGRMEIKYRLDQARSWKATTERMAASVDQFGDFDIDRASDLSVVFRLSTSGRVQEAINQAQKALVNYPDSPSLHYQLGILHKARNELDRAIEEFQNALELNPDHLLSLEQLTSIYIGLEFYQNAEPYVKHWIKIDPDNPVAHYNLAWCYIPSNDFKDAVEPLKTSVRLDPRNTRTLNEYGNVLRELGDDALAENIFRRALSLDPVAANPRLNLAMIYLADAKPGKAEEAIDPLTKSHQGEWNVLAVSSLVHARIGKFEEAARESEDALKTQPDNPLAFIPLVARSEVLANSGKGDEAIDLLEEAQTRDPDNVYVLQELSETYAALGKLDEAVALAREAKKRNPDRRATDELLMYSLAKQGRLEEAVAILDQLKDLSRKERDSMEGRIYEKSGNFSRAMAYYQSLLKKNPFYEEIHFRLGEIYLERGNSKEAIKHFFAVVDQNSGNFEARYLLARSLLAKKKYKQALIEARLLLKLSNGSEKRARGIIAMALYREKKYKESLEAFQEADEANSLDKEAMIVYVEVLKRLDRLDKAAAVLSRLNAADDLDDKFKNQIKKLAKNLPD